MKIKKESSLKHSKPKEFSQSEEAQFSTSNDTNVVKAVKHKGIRIVKSNKRIHSKQLTSSRKMSNNKSNKAACDNRSNQLNPNSSTFQQGLDNRSNQLNPNNALNNKK